MCTASASKPVRPVIYRLFCIKKRRKSVKLQVYLKLADGYYEMTFSIAIHEIELATPQEGQRRWPAAMCCECSVHLIITNSVGMKWKEHSLVRGQWRAENQLDQNLRRISVSCSTSN